MTALRLQFRPVVDDIDPRRFAKWVRELHGRCGAYVIRDVATGEVLYVGESHRGRLRQTLTRHFQRWTGYQAGTIYNRYRVEVAVYKLDATAREVAEAQEDLIRALDPRDNVHHKRALDLPDEPYDPSEFQDPVW
jgi:hypothetical protein